MTLKKLMSEYAYQLALGLLFIQVPFLNAPWIKPFITFFANKWLKPVFASMGKVMDFKIIDYEVAMQDKDFKEVVEKIKKIEESNRPIEEIPPDEIQKLRNEFHKNLNKLVKHHKSYN